MTRAMRFAVILVAATMALSLAGCGAINDFRAKFRKDPPRDDTVTWSQGAPPAHRNVALILDNSGSMNRNDESGMMLFSSLVFLDMLGEQDQVYVTGFPGKDVVPSDRASSGDVNSLCQSWVTEDRDQIGPFLNNADGNARLKNWVRALPYNSQITVFQEPLQRAVGALAGIQGDDSKRYVILFTDGNTDRGGDHSPGAMEMVHEREKQALLAYRNELVRQHIVFYGVVLGKATRDDHLRPLAEATGGAILRADNPADLVNRFADVFGRILETKVESVALEGTTQQRINRYVKEFILFIPTDGNSANMSFGEPGGRNLSGNIGGQDGFVRRDAVRSIEPYQIIHIRDPKPGDWEYKLSGAAREPALLIQNYDVYLQINGSYPRRGMMNMPNEVRGRLVDSRGQPIQDPEFYAEGSFNYGADYESQHEKSPPSETFDFAFEITPRDTLFHDLTCQATNGAWLTRTITVPFAGKDGVVLRVNNDADFGSIVPYADGMYFWWCRWVSKLLGLPASKDWHANKAEVRFVGTDPALKGVVFGLDETGLRDKHHVQLVDGRHRARFVIGDDYKATFKLDVDRSAKRLNERITVPIVYPKEAGKIRGDKEIGVKADIQQLNWAWRTSHFWLQWLIYLWILLFFYYRPLHYVFGYSTRGIRYRNKREDVPASWSGVTPRENFASAYMKALAVYPIGLVKGYGRVSSRSSAKEPDDRGSSRLRRMLAFASGLPAGPYVREFRARVDQRSEQFYKLSSGIHMRAERFERLKDPTAEATGRQLVRVSSITVSEGASGDGAVEFGFKTN